MKLMCGEDGPLGGASMTPYMGEGWSHDQAGVKEIGAQLGTSNHNSSQRRGGESACVRHTDKEQDRHMLRKCPPTSPWSPWRTAESPLRVTRMTTAS